MQLPICDKEKCWLPSTNGQFQYEVESNLVNLLDEQYGEVKNITVGVAILCACNLRDIIVKSSHSLLNFYCHAGLVLQSICMLIISCSLRTFNDKGDLF